MPKTDPAKPSGLGAVARSLGRQVAASVRPASCPACNGPMTQVRMVSTTGVYYCDRHIGSPQCLSCMGPSDPALGTEVQLCRSCVADSIRTQQDVKRVLPPIAEQLRRLGIRTSIPVQVRLVTRAELNGKYPGHENALGMTVSRGKDIVDLMVLRDLPLVKFGSTVAHEVMHAYLAQQGFGRVPTQVAEGLCQLLAYAWTRRQPGPLAAGEARLIEDNPHPVYGDGFRLARASAERIGVRRTLDHVRQYHVLP